MIWAKILRKEKSFFAVLNRPRHSSHKHIVVAEVLYLRTINTDFPKKQTRPQ